MIAGVVTHYKNKFIYLVAQMGIIPEQVFTHAVQNNLISRKQLQRLFITVKEVLNPAHRVQLFCPFGESESEGLLKKGYVTKQSSKTEHLSNLQQ